MKLFQISALLLLFAVSTITCKKSDPCEGVTCQNGGICKNGDCDCPPGYTRALCQLEVVPSSIKIESVRINYFPTTDGGVSWDLLDGPDVYLIIKDGAQVLYTGPFFEDAVLGQNLTFYPSYTDFFPERPLTFEVWDWDDNITAPDFMGAIEGKMYRAGQGFPAQFTMQCGACVVSFDVQVSYTY